MGVGWVARNTGGLYYTFFHGDYFINHEHFRIPPTSRFNGNVFKGLNTRIKQPGFNGNQPGFNGSFDRCLSFPRYCLSSKFTGDLCFFYTRGGYPFGFHWKVGRKFPLKFRSCFLFVGRRDPFDDPCFGWIKRPCFGGKKRQAGLQVCEKAVVFLTGPQTANYNHWLIENHMK